MFLCFSLLFFVFFSCFPRVFLVFSLFFFVFIVFIYCPGFSLFFCVFLVFSLFSLLFFVFSFVFRGEGPLAKDALDRPPRWTALRASLDPDYCLQICDMFSGLRVKLGK